MAQDSTKKWPHALMSVLMIAVGAASPRAQAEEHPQMTAPAIAQDRAQFGQCLGALWPQAQARGISRSVFEAALKPVEPDMRAIDLMRVQPEFERPLWKYLDDLVSADRIALGRAHIKQHENLFRRIEQTYGVDRYSLTALWAVESNFGKSIGERSVIRSTATLACIGRRKEYFANELLAALEILQAGDLSAQQLIGSWAGAFGPTQFMPSTFKPYAVDFDGDGRRDVVSSLADALASTANNLKQDGWQTGGTWGYEVVLPANFDYRLAASSNKMSVEKWEALGVKRVLDKPFSRKQQMATLGLPMGAKGPAFLLLPNFQAFRKYNGSEAYAYALGHLADRMMGGKPFITPWPRTLKMLSRSQRREMQQLLSHKGYDVGKIDGMIGGKTRDAVRDFQHKRGLLPDGYPNQQVLEHLRKTR